MNRLLLSMILMGSVFLGMVPGSVEAIDYRVDSEIRLSDTQEGNRYRVGSSITVSAPIQGDFVGVGEAIEITETVSEDILVAAQQVQISGIQSGDVRLAGGSVSLKGATVKGETVMLASDVIIDEDTVFEGDVLILANRVRMKGEVQGSLEIRANQVLLSELQAESVDISGRRVQLGGSLGEVQVRATQQLELNPEGSLSIEDLTYWAPESVEVVEETVWGDVVYDEDLLSHEQRMSALWGYRVQNRMVSVMTVLRVLWAAGMIGIVWLVFGRYFRQLSQTSGSLVLALQSMGIGLVAVVLTPVLGALIMVTVIGIPVGILVLGAYAAVLFVSMSVASVFAACVLNTVWQLEASSLRLYALSLGIYTAVLIGGIASPILGILGSVILVTWTIGSVIRDRVLISPDI